MYKWQFTAVTDEGRKTFTVKANNKQEAIDKSFAKLRKNGLDSIRWECTLVRNF